MQKRLFFVFSLLLLFSRSALAQSSLLNYGDTVLGTLTASRLTSTYTFNGAAGDLVTIEVIGIDIDPAANLNAPDQQQIARTDVTNTGSSDVSITHILPQDGTYEILVNSFADTPGQFLLRLNGGQPAVGQALTNMPKLVTLVAGADAQVFTFNADPAVPTTLNINAATLDFRFQAIIRNSSGQIIASITESIGIVFSLPLGEGAYTVEIAPSDPTRGGQVSIHIGPSAAAVPPPVETITTCMVSAQGGASVNVRSGPGVEFESLGLLQPGTRIVVTGVNGTWYQVDMPDVGLGWVRRDVVVGFGPCNSVPQVTSEPEATEESTDEVTETVTPTSTETATATATATATEEATSTASPTEEPTEDATATAETTEES